jgi:hypothetical protein
MFIYKITVIPLNQVYIGLDTKPSYKLSRWKTHQEIANKNPKTKLHKAMANDSTTDCKIEIVEEGFTSIGKLALAEIAYIKQFDSYKNGLNSTPGGDGLGVHDLYAFTDVEISEIKKALGDSFKDYNKNIKWANTTVSDRKEKTKHLHTAEIYKKKSNTLKEFYKANPEIKKEKGKDIQQWQKENLDIVKAQNKINSLKGAAKVSKKIVVEKEDGTVLCFNSKSEFNRSTGEWANTIIKKTLNGSFYNGYRIKENY